MGCGSSKQVAVTTAPTTAPAPAPASAPAETETQASRSGSRVQVTAAPTAAKKTRDAHSATSTDSGLADDDYDNKDGIITENTSGGEKLAASNRPPTPEFELAGRGYRDSQASIRAGARENSATSTFSSASSITTRSAPSILERPKSRGGEAFEVVYDDAPLKRKPTRLAAIERRKPLQREATLAELEAKLAAAERRRAEYERRVKQKMLEETEKVDRASRSLTRQKSNLGVSIEKAEDKAADNREKHLKQLRDKLKAKEARAKKVRANAARIKREEAKMGIKA